MSAVPHDWYEGFFEAEWLDYVALGDAERNEQQVAFLVEQLGLAERTRVLDLACGRGRIAIPLAERGCRVTGLDLSPRSLELARRDAADAGVALPLIHADMRDLDAVGSFDVVLNLFTSFGYFENQADDERVVAAVGRALVPGGAFFLDVLNPVALAAVFAPEKLHEFDDGTLMPERRSVDHLRGRLEARWTFIRPDGTRTEISHSVRAYTPVELVAMLAKAGLETKSTWGSWDGSPLGEGTRTILLARKAA